MSRLGGNGPTQSAVLAKLFTRRTTSVASGRHAARLPTITVVCARAPPRLPRPPAARRPAGSASQRRGPRHHRHGAGVVGFGDVDAALAHPGGRLPWSGRCHRRGAPPRRAAAAGKGGPACCGAGAQLGGGRLCARPAVLGSRRGGMRGQSEVGELWRARRVELQRARRGSPRRMWHRRCGVERAGCGRAHRACQRVLAAAGALQRPRWRRSAVRGHAPEAWAGELAGRCLGVAGCERLPADAAGIRLVCGRPAPLGRLAAHRDPAAS